MNTPPPIDKPPRAITLYIPAALALLMGVGSAPACACSWPERLGEGVLATGFAFLLFWPFVQGCYHGFCFVRSLFRRQPRA